MDNTTRLHCRIAELQTELRLKDEQLAEARATASFLVTTLGQEARNLTRLQDRLERSNLDNASLRAALGESNNTQSRPQNKPIAASDIVQSRRAEGWLEDVRFTHRALPLSPPSTHEQSPKNEGGEGDDLMTFEEEPSPICLPCTSAPDPTVAGHGSTVAKTSGQASAESKNVSESTGLGTSEQSATGDKEQDPGQVRTIFHADGTTSRLTFAPSSGADYGPTDTASSTFRANQRHPAPFADHEHNRLMGAACYVEAMSSIEQTQLWNEYASKRNSRHSAQEWQTYYEKEVRPLHLAKTKGQGVEGSEGSEGEEDEVFEECKSRPEKTGSVAVDDGDEHAKGEGVAEEAGSGIFTDEGDAPVRFRPQNAVVAAEQTNNKVIRDDQVEALSCSWIAAVDEETNAELPNTSNPETGNGGPVDSLANPMEFVSANRNRDITATPVAKPQIATSASPVGSQDSSSPMTDDRRSHFVPTHRSDDSVAELVAEERAEERAMAGVRRATPPSPTLPRRFKFGPPETVSDLWAYRARFQTGCPPETAILLLRTVMITGVPSNITLAEVLQKVGGGMVMSAVMIDTRSMKVIPRLYQNMIKVTFVDAGCAQDFVSFCHENVITFWSTHWRRPWRMRVEMHPFPSVSDPPGLVSLIYEDDMSRVLFIQDDGRWGLEDLVAQIVNPEVDRLQICKRPLHVERDDRGTLALEFASVTDAANARNVVRRNGLVFGRVHTGFLSDPCERPLESLRSMPLASRPNQVDDGGANSDSSDTLTASEDTSEEESDVSEEESGESVENEAALPAGDYRSSDDGASSELSESDLIQLDVECSSSSED